MPFSPVSLEENPYIVCVSCTKIGHTCDGPNFLAMTVDQFCQWCRVRRDYLGWRNSFVAERACVSKVSVDRVMAGDSKDLRITTMQAIAKALVNGVWGQSPCVLITEPHNEVYAENPILMAQCQHMQNTLDKLTEDFRSEMDLSKEEAHQKIQFLKEQVAVKDRQIELLHQIISDMRYK